MKKLLAGFSAGWQAMPQWKKDILTKRLAVAIANPIAYVIYRKLGAEKWQAWAAVTIASQIANGSLDIQYTLHETSARKTPDSFEQMLRNLGAAGRAASRATKPHGARDKE